MKHKLLVVILPLMLILTSCALLSVRSGTEPTGTPAADSRTSPAVLVPTQTTVGEPDICPVAGETTAAVQPVEIQGAFSFTNDIILTYYVEHAVALVDMYGFVMRDQEWEIPVASQTMGFTDRNEEEMSATYIIQLPARPGGQLVDVNPDNQQEKGLQVFAVSYWPNLTGGPYSEGDDRSTGWPSYLASVKVDTENKDEVTGGKLVIWAPDDQQSFPNDFGPDGLLFTGDDPVTRVPAGYSIVDLDQKPFAFTREEVAEMTLFEPQDIAVKDFSQLSYQEAFDQMFEIVRREYAFNGITGKQPNWDALYSQLSPRIEEAGQKKDAEAFYLALRDFTFAFRDGHVSVSGGEDSARVQERETSGGYGFAIRELDDGRVIAVFVQEGGPASEAGMLTGAEITEFNGQPIKEAIAAVAPANGPHSTDFSLRYYQAQYLLRAPVKTKAEVTFTNPDGSAQTATLTAVREMESLYATSPYRFYDPDALPVEYIVASNIGLGYVKINSNMDDLNLIIRLFQRALEKFEENNIQSLVIDMRTNFGGANLGLAGFLTDKEIPLGQLQYYSEKTGQFESERPVDEVLPNEKQFRFQKMFLLVDQACASACELEAYGFSQVPGMVVIGQYPTAGVEAEVARGQFELPEGFTVVVPTGRFVLPDGSIFLEGQGVQPTERIPITEETVLSTNDPVLQRAVQLAQE